MIYGRDLDESSSDVKGGSVIENKNLVFLRYMKIPLGIFEADALDDPAERLLIVGILAVFHPGANPLAENATEIFMPCVA